MRGNVLVKYLCALGVAVVIIFLAHHATNDFKAKMKVISETEKSKNIQNVKKKKRPAFDYEVDWKKNTVTVSWRRAKNASKYHLVCYETGDEDMKIIKEQDISAVKEPSCTHEIVYGAKYEYEIRIYQMKEGKELWATTKEYALNVVAPDLWNEVSNGVSMSKTMEDAKLFIEKHIYEGTAPTGIEIYRGESQQQMELVDTVMWDELPDSDEFDEFDKYNEDGVYKVYTDRRNSYADYYQIRSFVDFGGERQYGKKSEARLFLAKGYQGEVEAELKISQKPKINKIEVIMTNKSKLPFRMGRKFIKNYFQDETEKEFPFCLYAYSECDISANSLGIDEISYKFHSSDEYQILSEKDIVSIDPQDTIYIRFARSDHKKFENRFYYFSEEGIYTREEDICIYLFQYMDKKVFLNIGNKSLYSCIGWEKLNEPYGHELTA